VFDRTNPSILNRLSFDMTAVFRYFPGHPALDFAAASDIADYGRIVIVVTHDPARADRRVHIDGKIHETIDGCDQRRKFLFPLPQRPANRDREIRKCVSGPKKAA
jgi:hypothetical protein